MSSRQVSPSTLHAASDQPTLTALEPLARAALAQYGIVAAELQNLRHFHNSSYRVRADDGRAFVLRVTSHQHSEARLRSEMLCLRALRSRPGLHVPEPVAALDGRLVVHASTMALPRPRACNLFRWMDGTPGVEEFMSAADYAALGTACAQLHCALTDYEPSPGFDRPHWDEDFCLHPDVIDSLGNMLGWLRGQFPPDAAGRFEALVQQARASMAYLRGQPHGHGLVHGDLHPGNCLLRPEGVAFFDFEDLGWGCDLYDIATALFGAIERPDYLDLANAFSAAYARIRPLPADFERRLVQFHALRAVFLTQLVVGRGDLAESVWWQGFVVGKLRRLLNSCGPHCPAIFMPLLLPADPRPG